MTTQPTNTPAADLDALEKLAAIVSDEEIVRVHGNANFGTMDPREVVNDGVRKTAVGYHCGSTQIHILRDHGLVTKPRPGSSDIDLTKKGKAYARALIPFHKALIAEVREARGLLEPFALLAVDEENGIKGVNMNDPISKWLTVAQLVDARAFLAKTDSRFAENAKQTLQEGWER